ncbi:nuclear transport factor 2 family protein [Maricaulaceae bacterium NA33B04]|nr:nuclear transport factor 2 family protein [Maricaulaceae bacterium NA33B04]
MRFSNLLGAGVIALALSTPAFAGHADHPGESAAESGVRAAVMNYFETGNQGDPTLAERAFQTDVGDMFIRRTDEAGNDAVVAMNLGDFANRMTRPSPVERNGEILNIRILDETMAFAHFSFTAGERQFDDFFLLYLINDEWKIVSKAYTLEAIEE